MTNDSTKYYSKEYLDKIIKEDRKAYYKNWRSKNKDKIKEQNARYWKKRAEKILRERETNKKC